MILYYFYQRYIRKSAPHFLFVTFPSRSMDGSKQNNYMINSKYESPQVEVIEVLLEGVLCASGEGGTDMIPDDGNM